MDVDVNHVSKRSGPYGLLRWDRDITVAFRSSAHHRQTSLKLCVHFLLGPQVLSGSLRAI